MALPETTGVDSLLRMSTDRLRQFFDADDADKVEKEQKTIDYLLDRRIEMTTKREAVEA